MDWVIQNRRKYTNKSNELVHIISYYIIIMKILLLLILISLRNILLQLHVVFSTSIDPHPSPCHDMLFPLSAFYPTTLVSLCPSKFSWFRTTTSSIGTNYSRQVICNPDRLLFSILPFHNRCHRLALHTLPPLASPNPHVAAVDFSHSTRCRLLLKRNINNVSLIKLRRL